MKKFVKLSSVFRLLVLLYFAARMGQQSGRQWSIIDVADAAAYPDGY